MSEKDELLQHQINALVMELLRRLFMRNCPWERASWPPWLPSLRPFGIFLNPNRKYLFRAPSKL